MNATLLRSALVEQAIDVQCHALDLDSVIERRQRGDAYEARLLSTLRDEVADLPGEHGARIRREVDTLISYDVNDENPDHILIKNGILIARRAARMVCALFEGLKRIATKTETADTAMSAVRAS